MSSFGLLVYGPAQHFWYRLLDRQFAAKTAANFAAKVGPICIGPCHRIQLSSICIGICICIGVVVTQAIDPRC